MSSLDVIMRDPATLRDRRNNPKRHPEKQIKQLMRSIGEFGFYTPVIIDETGIIIAGHGRAEAARRLCMRQVPCIELRGLSEARKQALMLADNKIAANATIDNEKLFAVIHEIIELDGDYDLSLTGYDAIELDQIEIELNPEDPDGPSEDDQLPAIGDGPPVSVVGDLWKCGNHLALCGDARQPVSYEALLGSERAEMVLTDPPYNVKVQGHIGGLGKVRHREFAMASGEMSANAFTGFLRDIMGRLVSWTSSGSLHFFFMDWRHMQEILAAGHMTYSEFKNLIVWVKDNGGMGSFYRSRHELIFIFKNGTAPHINNFELGQKGRYRTNVWQYRGMNSAGSDRNDLLGLHPTVKPVRMLADAMLDCSNRGGIVLDVFGGSGSTLIAAEKTGRRARLMEIDPVYVDRMIRRWQAFAHDDAIHLATGETFDERAARTGENGDRNIAAPVVSRPDPACPSVRRVRFGEGKRHGA